jgi:small subunit ribosomal protein S16
MALKIRLRQQGCNNRQTYRVVVTDIRSKRDGQYVEKLGWYLPHLRENNCSIDADRMSYWLEKGAQMSEQVKALAEENVPEVIKKYNELKEKVRANQVAKRRAKKSQTAKKK